MIKLLNILKWLFIAIIGFLAVPVFNFFTDLLIFPGRLPPESLNETMPMMLIALAAVALSAIGLILINRKKRKLDN